MYNHHATANEKWYGALNDTPGLVGPRIEPPPASIREYFNNWLEGDGYPFWSFWENISSWWNVRHLPNVMLVHFNELKRDLPGEIQRIAAFLDIAIDQKRWPAIREHCGFDYMKAHAADVVPLAGALWEGGAQTFLHKGTNARWRDVLSREEIARYEQIAREKLGDACFARLVTGNLPGERLLPPPRREYIVQWHRRRRVAACQDQAAPLQPPNCALDRRFGHSGFGSERLQAERRCSLSGAATQMPKLQIDEIG